MPEPRRADALVGPELGGEVRGRGRRGQDREVAQAGAALAPGIGRLEAGREGLDDFLRLGRARAADPLGAAGREGGVGLAGEGALGLGEPGQLGGVEQEDLTVRLDVVAVARDGGADRGFVGGAGAQPEGHLEALAVRRGAAGDLGGTEMGRVPLKVGRELGVEAGAQAGPVGGEKIQGLVPVAEPPFSAHGFEAETAGLEQIERRGIGGVFARGQRDGEVMLRAIHQQRRGGVVARPGALAGGRGPGAGGRGARPRGRRWGRLPEMLGDPHEGGSDPEQGDGRGAGREKDRLPG